MTELLKPPEVARILRVGRCRIYQLLASGTVPSIRVGKVIRVPREALEEWIRRHTKGGEAEK